MNRQDQLDEDILKRYINPERIEKAPEGFTAKTMTRIRIDIQPEKIRRRVFYRNPVTMGSVIVIALLISAVIILPSDSSGFAGKSVLKWIGDPEISLPPLTFKLLADFELPGWGIYTLVGFLFLAIFDRGLSALFKKEKN